jgi:Anthranilate/para-aminobenzoate synthases component II
MILYYNLVHLVEKITHEKVDVYRNDQIPMEKVKDYDKIILSPGRVFLKKRLAFAIDKRICFIKINTWEFV